MKDKNQFIKACIAKALVELMKEKDLKDISITEITKKAGVSRMSYYRNYYYKEDILNSYMDEILNTYNEYRISFISSNGYSIYPIILHVFETFKQHKDFVLALDRSNLSSIIQNKLNEYIKEIYNADDVHSTYQVIMFSGALYNSCKTWLSTGLNEDPKFLARIFVERMFPDNKI